MKRLACSPVPGVVPVDGLFRRRLLLTALACTVVGPLRALAAELAAASGSRLWLDESGQPLPQAGAALRLLADAASHGLAY